MYTNTRGEVLVSVWRLPETPARILYMFSAEEMDDITSTRCIDITTVQHKGPGTLMFLIFL